EARAESRLLDAEISADELDLFVETDPLVFAFAQRVAEDFGELFDGLFGSGGIRVDQPGDGVERVEEEMRVDLRAESFELGAAGELADPNAFEHDAQRPGEGLLKMEIVAEIRDAVAALAEFD